MASMAVLGKKKERKKIRKQEGQKCMIILGDAMLIPLVCADLSKIVPINPFYQTLSFCKEEQKGVLPFESKIP